MYWTAGRNHIAKKQRKTSSAWKDFGYLYLKVLEVERKTDPLSQDISLSSEDLDRYLSDEIALGQSRTLIAITPSDSQTPEEEQ